MRVVVIGATGHVGTYLIPRLSDLGHHIIAISRGNRKPYIEHPAWREVETLNLDRHEYEADGRFGEKVAALSPDVVIDMICFTRDSAQHLVDSLRDKVQLLITCGTIWIHGPSISVPTSEEENRHPFGEYGVHKLQMTDYLLREARQRGFPATVLHPGHIVGEGWVPINPLGNFNLKVFEKLARGHELAFPTLGMETVHHVHADDVAQAFIKSMTHWNHAVGEDFHVVSEHAISLRGYAERAARWFGKKPNLKFLAGDDWTENLTNEDVEKAWDHISRSPNSSIEKAKHYLEYAPRYSSFDAIFESLQWLIEKGKLSID